MRRAAIITVSHVSLAGWLLATGSLAAGRAEAEQEKYEEKAVSRSAERLHRFLNTDRGVWVKELEDTFPGRVADATKADEYAAWFELLAGEGEEWRRADAPNARIAALFDRVIDRLELGPVPAVSRREFLRYVERVLIRDARRARERLPDPKEESDKVFRILDGNGDGVLERTELTARLADDRGRTDTDANGRIDKDEYRAYFERRVIVAVETTPAEKSDDRSRRGPLPKTDQSEKEEPELPDWFTTFDADEDTQVALHEWRKAGRSLDAFTEMDLDDDGLLTRDEYLRFAEANEKVSGGDPPPEAGRSGKN
jgi:Ca2+-binding EF-hand superfamily protein